MPTTPWDAIERSPDTYFDINSLPPGASLRKPDTFTYAQVHLLIEHIIDCQSAPLRRFTFRSKNEIRERLNIAEASEKPEDDDFDASAHPAEDDMLENNMPMPDVDASPPSPQRAPHGTTSTNRGVPGPDNETESEEDRVKECVDVSSCHF